MLEAPFFCFQLTFVRIGVKYIISACSEEKNVLLSESENNFSAFPLKVLQFGEGNFLRAFLDVLIDVANEKGLFDGSIAIVKPTNHGKLSQYYALQNRLYTVVTRGIDDGKKCDNSRIISSVSSFLSCYDDYDSYSALSFCETLEFVISNTTEAGIVLDESDDFSLCPPKSFPGKLTKFLYLRAEHFDYALDKGLMMLPCELIENNGNELKKCVMALAQKWNLGKKFTDWIDSCCIFASTLVDRIVSGYPKDEERQLWQRFGYEDHLMVTCEPYFLWVIEDHGGIRSRLHFENTGLPVIFTESCAPYRERKVRILNGAHTSFVPSAFLCGYDTVFQAINDALFHEFVSDTLTEEVIPTLSMPEPSLDEFAVSVLSRFANPFINHCLISICMNCVSKWRARCLPTLLGYVEKYGAVPKHITFSLSALIALYSSGKHEDGSLVLTRNGEDYTLRDSDSVLEFFSTSHNLSLPALVHSFLSCQSFWGMDMTHIPCLENEVLRCCNEIDQCGMEQAIRHNFPANGGHKDV